MIMLKKVMPAVIFGLLLGWTATAAAGQKIVETPTGRANRHVVYMPQEGINEVAVSNQEINRIEADRPILNIKMDENAQITADPNGETSFFLQISGSKKELIYINTEDAVYTVRLKPRRMEARTLKLMGGEKQSAMPLIGNEREKIAVRLIKAAFTEDTILEKARMSQPYEEMRLIQDIEIKKYRRYDFDEDNLYLMVYIIKLANPFKYDKFKISEKNFLLPELCKKPIGLALSRDFLSKTGYTRLFIVGRNQ
jgi:hypothetical protein